MQNMVSIVPNAVKKFWLHTFNKSIYSVTVRRKISYITSSAAGLRLQDAVYAPKWH